MIHFVIDENANGPRRYVSTAVSSPAQPRCARPTLIVHGAKDIVVDSVNAIVLEENLCDARLLMLGSKVTQVQLNSLFAQLSSLADKVSPFVAYCHLRRAAEHLA